MGNVNNLGNLTHQYETETGGFCQKNPQSCISNTCRRRFSRLTSSRTTAWFHPSSRKLSQSWSGTIDSPYRISVPTEKIPMFGVRRGAWLRSSLYFATERPVEKTRVELCAYSDAHRLLNRRSAAWDWSVWSTWHDLRVKFSLLRLHCKLHSGQEMAGSSITDDNEPPRSQSRIETSTKCLSLTITNS